MIDQVLRTLMVYTMTIGLVWMGALVSNPEFSSGTVTFIGFSIGVGANFAGLAREGVHASS